MKFFGKKDSEEKDDSNYGNEEEDYYKNNRLKTDYDYGGKLLIKSKLKKLGKEGLASNDNSTSSKNDNYKSFNTIVKMKSIRNQRKKALKRKILNLKKKIKVIKVIKDKKIILKKGI